MTRHLVSKRVTALCAAMILAGTQALAAVADGSNSGGGSEPPEPSSDAETGWNPVVRCVVGRDTSLEDLFECLAMGIDPWYGCPADHPTEQDGPDGMGGEEPNTHLDIEASFPDQDCEEPQSRRDFIVHLISTPRTGINIVRKDNGGEPASLFFRENSRVLQWTTITLDHPDNQVARIHEVTETAGGGHIRVYLNSDTIDVETRSHTLPIVVNQQLVAAIEAAGYTVLHERPYIVVFWDRDENRTPTYLGFQSLDTGIVQSEIRLEPVTGPPNQNPPVIVRSLN